MDSFTIENYAVLVMSAVYSGAIAFLMLYGFSLLVEYVVKLLRGLTK